MVPGSEEKEHRGHGSEGPAVRLKEIHPSGIGEDLSEDSDGEADEEENSRLNQAREIARRQSEPAFLSSGKGRMRSPPPEVRTPIDQEDDEDEVEDSVEN